MFVLFTIVSSAVWAQQSDPLPSWVEGLIRSAIIEFVQQELALDGIDDCKPSSATWKEVKDRIKLMLILKKIARQEGIEVGQTDVKNRIAEKAEEFGTSMKSLEAEFAQGNGMQRLKDMLLAESSLDYLMGKNL